MEFSWNLWKRCLIYVVFGLTSLALVPSVARAQATNEQKQAILKLLDDAQKATDPAIATETIQTAVKMALNLKDKTLAATVQYQWAYYLADHRELHDALPHFQNAFNLFQELKDDYDCGLAAGKLFDIYRLLGDNKEAFRHGDLCLLYLIKAKASQQLIQGLLEQLELTKKNENLFPTPADREWYERYRDLAKAAGVNVGAAIMQTDMADCIILSDPAEALRLYEDALPSLQSDPDAYVQIVTAKAKTAIGGIYLDWGLCDEASPIFDEVEPLLQKRAQAGDINAESLLARLLIGRGTVDNMRHHYDQARAEWGTGIRQAKKAGKQNEVAGLEALLSAIPQADQENRPDPSVLLRDAERILAQRSPSDIDLMQASSQLMIAGWTLTYKDRFAQGREALLKAKTAWERLSVDPPATNNLVAILIGLGVVETELKHDGEANKYLQQAIEQQVTLSHSIISPFQQAKQYSLGVAAYRALARLRLRQGRREEALVLLEQGRVQSLAAQYTQLTAMKGLKASDLADFIKVSQALLAKTTPTTDALLAYNREMEKLRQSGALPDFTPMRLEQGDIHLLTQSHPDTLFLEWSLLDDHTVLLIAFGSKDKIWSSEWRVPRNSLRTNLTDNPAETETAARWLKAVRKRYGTEPALASKVYKYLFTPLETKTEMLKPGRYRRLALVTDGEMANLPFAALQDTAGNRLLNRYIISVHFALKLLVKPLIFSGQNARTLVVADPRPDTQPLKIAHESAQRVARMFPKVTFLAGKEATQTAVFAAMKQSTLLVFATHGRLAGLNPSLLLADDPTVKDNARLEAWQVALMPLHARLAVLWGCQTGLGKLVGMEGIIGFVWAFHAAGCPAVVCSQWEVNQQTASDLMVAFHKNLREGFEADEALAQAMRSMQKNRNPVDWAPFQLYGTAKTQDIRLTIPGNSAPVIKIKRAGIVQHLIFDEALRNVPKAVLLRQRAPGATQEYGVRLIVQEGFQRRDGAFVGSLLP